MTLFDNTQRAYIHKSRNELYKTYLLFTAFSYPFFVRISGQIVVFLLQIGFPIKGLLKRTIFEQFCAGQQENDSLKVVQSLNSFNIKSYMHYASEGQKTETGMEESLSKILETIKLSQNNESLPFTVFKSTALGSSSLFEKKTAGIALSDEEQLDWNQTLNRIYQCGEEAQNSNVRLLIDAEESWLQGAIDQIALDLMKKYNKGNQPLIYTTIQMYRKDRLPYLKKLLDQTKTENFQMGVKLVRGAYLEKENQRALTQSYPSPICESKEATDENFNQGLYLILNHLDHCELFLGSHSEDSTQRVLDWMEEHQIPASNSRIWFSQLYGMADFLSFNLANLGYQVVKYVPYGPIKEVIPYLIRRAEENSSVQGQSPRELTLIKRELKRRRTLKAESNL